MALTPCWVMLVLVCLALSVGVACDRSGDRGPGAPEPGEAVSLDVPAEPAPRLAAALLSDMPPLLRTAARAADRGYAQGRVTAIDWTTARQADEQLAGMPLDEHATLLLLEATRIATGRMWERASARSGATVLTAADVNDLAAALAEADAAAHDARADAHDAAVGRVLQSVLFDAASVDGLLARYLNDLPAVDDAALAAMAQLVGRVRIRMLRQAARSAEAAGRATVAAEDVKHAFERLADELDLTDSPQGRALHARRGMDLRQHQRAIVLHDMDCHLHALAGTTDAQAVRQLLVRALAARGGRAFADDGVDALIEHAYAMPVFLGTGLRPRRRDTDPGHDFPMPTETTVRHEAGPRRAHLDLRWMVNQIPQMLPLESASEGEVAVTAIVPHVMRKDGRTSVYFSSESIQPQVLAPADAAALRATGIHWLLLRRSFERDEAAVIDPLAADLLAERVLQSLVLHVRLLERMAQAMDAPVIDAALIHSDALRAVKLQPPATPVPPRSAAVQTRVHLLNAMHPGPLFEDVTIASGIAQRVYIRDTVASRHADIGSGAPNGAGIAVGDYDGDGLVDLFLAGDGNNRLYRNRGDFQFEDVTEAVGIDDARIDDARHALFADVDGDGRLDLLIVHNLSPSSLFMQQADGTFIERAKAHGLLLGPGATTAAFFDYDNDGDLDLYVGCYGATSQPGRVPPSLDGRNADANQLFRNNGDSTFTDVTAEAGVGSTAWTLACGAADFNGDGLADIYLANDFGADQLYINRGDGRFDDVAPAVGLDDRGSGMTASFPDINADGRPDVYVSVIDTQFRNVRYHVPLPEGRRSLHDHVMRSHAYVSGNKLLRNERGEYFTPVEERYFERAPKGWSWGALFFDYDNDGDDDMYLATGWFKGHYNHNDPNLMFLRDGDLFLHVKPTSPQGFRANSRGAAAVDLDNDGAIDLIVNNFGSPPRVLRNVQRTDNRWVKVRLRGERHNRHGIGATIRAFPDGLPPITRLVTCGSAYLSQDDTTVTIGIGRNDQLDRILVHWPGGHTQVIERPMAAGSIIDIAEPR